MNYDFAKKLKDAGWEQKVARHECYQKDLTSNEVCVSPSLSELIEACGDGFQALIARGEREGDRWEARGSQTRHNANTAEEAVGDLWITLNKP